MAGGLPMGAILIGPRIPQLTPGVHASTFGGNPLISAAAAATVDLICEQDLATRAARLGAWMMDELRKIDSPRVKEVRGLGLLVGIELNEDGQKYITALRERGVLAMAAGPTVLRFVPPLVIEESDLAEVVSKVREVLTA